MLAAETSLCALDLAGAAARWLRDFEGAITRGDAEAAANMFAADSHWRDLVAFTWHIRTFTGVDAIRDAMCERLPWVQPRNFRIAEGRTPPRVVLRAGVENIEAIIAFETATGNASGVLRLVPSKDDPKKLLAWVFLTSLDEIKGHEERIGERRPRGEEWSGGFGGGNWLDHRISSMSYTDREPAVVVVGGSQSGLGIAACLNILGIDTLVIDKHERVGDAWRKRYHNLTLHNEVFVDHLPYLPSPQTILCTFRGTRSRIGSSSTRTLWRSTFGLPPNSLPAAMMQGTTVTR